MPDTRPRLPEEEYPMNLQGLRDCGTIFSRMRLTLQAKLVETMRTEDPTRNTPELDRLQRVFEHLMHALPMWLRMERTIAKHCVDPATRELTRKGILTIAHELRDRRTNGLWTP